MPEIIAKVQSKRDESAITQNKIETFRRKYGVDNAQQIPEIKGKTMQTCLEKYGATTYVNSDEYNEIRRKYLNDEYGVDSYFQTDEFKEKAKATLIERYGTDQYFKFGSLEYKKRFLELYGVENPMQVPEIAEKVLDGYKGYYNTNKFYTLPSGKKVRIQGYENKTFDKLFKLGYSEHDLQ